MPRSKNRHTRRAQKRRRKEKHMTNARRREFSKESRGDAGVAMCGRKVRCRSEQSAVAYGLRRYGTVMRAYRCPVCHGWHVTSRG